MDRFCLVRAGLKVWRARDKALALALVLRAHSIWAAGAVQDGKPGFDGLIALDGPLPRRPVAAAARIRT